MGTPFSEIIDLALIVINDYKFSKLYNKDPVAFNKFCDGFLIRAIPQFKLCKQSLKYNLDYSAYPPIREFVNELNCYEKDILADYWALEWFTREVQNAAQIANKLSNSGSFKTVSEPQKFKAKQQYLDEIREKVSQKTVDYLLMDTYTLAT